MTSFASISVCDRGRHGGPVPHSAGTSPAITASAHQRRHGFGARDTGHGVASARPGSGELEVIRDFDRSVVSRALATSPLRLLTPANHGQAAWIYTSTFGGGLVDGDAMSLNVTIGARACAFLSTQASTKVYRSPRGTVLEMSADVRDEGLLIVVPDPVVCFAASRYRQVQRVDLAGQAGLVLVDWLTSGRRASGERWAFDEYVSRTIVLHRGRLVLHDAVALRAKDGDLATRIGRFDVLALLVILGVSVRREAAALVSQINGKPLTRQAELLLSASALGETGCVIRIAGHSVEQVALSLRQLLGFVPALLGDDPWSRKW